MKQTLKSIGAIAAALIVTTALILPPISETLAQTAPNAAAPATARPPSVIKAVQEALNRQGFTVKTDGVFDDETRSALRNFQTRHHLTVTGELDGATLAKLGVAAQGAASASTIGQAPPSTAGSTTQQTPVQPKTGTPGMMDMPMMQGMMMQGMMQTMHGMMGMMEDEMQSRSGPMHSGRMQGSSDMAASDCPMRSGGQMSGPAMMQMMQGMMQMMRAMQNQMQPNEKSQGAQ